MELRIIFLKDLLRKSMRLYKLFFVVQVLAFGFLSCNDPGGENTIEDPDTPPATTLSVSAGEFVFTSEGGTQGLTITSNAAWTANYAPDSWYRTSLQGASGNATIDIIVDENILEESRIATIIIKADGVDDITVTISQDGKEAPEIPEDPELPDYIPPDNTNMRSLSTVELSMLMGIGWNLGNTLEAINVNGGVLTGNETTWGNPVVTKEFIDAVKTAGFNTVRIPVSWSHNIEDPATHKIQREWLNRVEEIVNYVLDNEMYAMINIHWDGGWMNQPFYAEQAGINTKLAAYWKQISRHFRDYNDYLIFAGTNEVHVENYYGEPTAENLDVQNSFNQTFVDAVRATGGRNAYRYLVVQGYNTNIAQTISGMVIPDDNIDDKLMIEVHYYDPYDFTLMETGSFKTQWGKNFTGGDVSNWGQEEWVDETFEKMKINFVDKGYGVILGEYAATLRANLPGQALADHLASRNDYLHYVTAAALRNGMVPCYWDNGYTGNLGSGLFDRRTGDYVYADAINAIITAGNP